MSLKYKSCLPSVPPSPWSTLCRNAWWMAQIHDPANLRNTLLTLLLTCKKRNPLNVSHKLVSMRCIVSICSGYEYVEDINDALERSSFQSQMSDRDTRFSAQSRFVCGGLSQTIINMFYASKQRRWV